MRATTTSMPAATTTGAAPEHHRGLTGASVCGSCVRRESCFGRLFCDRRAGSDLARRWQAS